MRKSLLFPIALLGAVLFARPAAAGAADHAEAVSIAAHDRASKLRHQWDKARSDDASLAACLESKVMQAVGVAKRIDESRASLRDLGDDQERARRLAAIDRLGERSGELAREAQACEPQPAFGGFATQAGTLVDTQISGNIAPAPLDGGDSNDLLGSFPPALWSALLLLR